jgi:hypothetical protein
VRCFHSPRKQTLSFRYGSGLNLTLLVSLLQLGPSIVDAFSRLEVDTQAEIKDFAL